MKKTGEKSKAAVLWFTGLSGSGKSTIAAKVFAALERAGVDVETLDGDGLRSVFPGAGFSKQARDEHVRRVGHTAGLLEKHGVTVIASFVSPYEEARNFARSCCRRFMEIYVETPLSICEERDVKGLYAKARRGEIQNFTGVSDPYEPPRKPEITIRTEEVSADEACRIILEYLDRETK